MTAVHPGSNTGRKHPPLAGSLAYLLLNLPLGILWFTLFVTLIAVGVSTAIIWVGLGVSALAVLTWRAAAQFERRRTQGLLRTDVEAPYRPLPPGTQKQRWKARLREGSTWRDLAYLVLLLPFGIVEFTLVVTFWAVGLALVGLPVYYRFLPGGVYHFPSATSTGPQWITVDSTVSALPWAVLGLVVVAVAIVLTKTLAGGHARFARALLGPRNHHPHPNGENTSPANPTTATSPTTRHHTLR